MTVEDLSAIFSNIWAIVMVLVFFGGSIFVHELGHFLAARRRGLYVERFSIGFGPKLFGWKSDGVEYRVSLLPLGGYVALPQLADMRGIEGETEIDTRTLPPISFSSKVIVAVAGAVFNILFAFLIATVLWFVKVPASESSLSTTVGYVAETVVTEDGTEVPSPARQAGLQLGDQIIAVDGHPVDSFLQISQLVAISSGKTEEDRRRTDLTVLRDGEKLTLITHPIISEETQRRQIGFGPSSSVLIGELRPGSPAAEAGLQSGDQITQINGQRVYGLAHFVSLINERGDQPVEITLQREQDGEPQTLVKTLTPTPTEAGTYSIGIASFARKQSYIVKDPLTVIEETIVLTGKTIASLVNRHSDVKLSDMSGPVGIARLIHQTAQIDFRLMLWIIVLINVNLAIFNLLPIPVLDGGHIVFATIAKLRKKPLPLNIIASIQGSFMILLLALICYVTFFDISRLVSESRADEEPAPEPPQQQQEEKQEPASE